MEEKFINKLDEKYINNNIEINKKYFYIINHKNNDFYIHKNQFNKYNNIITNPLEFEYSNKYESSDFISYYYCKNEELYINNYFLINFFDKCINELNDCNDIVLQCDKIIIDIDNDIIEPEDKSFVKEGKGINTLKQYLINNNINNIRIILEGHTIIFKNVNIDNIDLIDCYNFISISDKINQSLNEVNCSNFIINKELININWLHRINKITINSNSSYKCKIKFLSYDDNFNDFNNLKLFENYYIIDTLYLYRNQKFIDLKCIYNINLILHNNIVLQNDINNSQLIIHYRQHINFNNHKINKVCVYIDSCDNINDYIKKILINNSINELTIIPFSKEDYLINNEFNQILDFQNIKLNKLNIYKEIKIKNINNINNINEINEFNEFY